MPVVLTTAPGQRRSGHTYDDRTGVAYEFPGGRYEKLIQAGERFVYFEPRTGYTGTGVIGTIEPSHTAGRLVAEILDYEPLADAVAIASPDGTYYEADRAFWKDKVYWAQGVRPLRDERLLAILRRGQPPVPPPVGPDGSSGAYATSVVAKAVERYAVDVAMALLEAEGQGLDVTEMPRNNPGFDICQGAVSEPVLFVEVKGTQSIEPVFFLSEGERAFSLRNAQRYLLIVVTGIDLKQQAHSEVHRREGAIDSPAVVLKPTQWRAKLETPI